MKLICELFGHKYKYYIVQDSPQRNIRFCKRCNKAGEWKTIPGMVNSKWIWMTLVGRTDNGAKEFLKSLEK